MVRNGLALAALFALAVAGPLSPLDVHRSKIPHVRRQEEYPEPDDPEAWCPEDNIDFSDPDEAARVWDDWAVGWYMDIKLDWDNEAQEDWVEKMADFAFPGAGLTEAADCFKREGLCFTGGLLDCREMASVHNGMEYYILSAVKNMQAIFERAHTDLQDETILNTLAVSSIVDDFSLDQEPNPGSDILGFISGAFTVAAGLAAFAHPGTRFAAGIAGGSAIIASRASIKDPNMIDASSLDKTLSTSFSAIRDGLDEQLAMANGKSEEEDPDYTILANPGDRYYTSIAAYFDAGKFLLEGYPENMFSEGFGWLQKALVSEALDSVGWAILGMDDKDEDSCGYNENVSDTYGSQWMEDIEGGSCLSLFRPVTGHRDYHWETADKEIFDKLTDDYGIDLKQWFQAAYDCAVSDADAPDPEEVPEDDELPLCFYRIKCMDSDMETGVMYDYRDEYDWEG